ncbi:SDR family NAD(P)-dependent oxidoreductase [Salisediminibacterium selenitireducens]|uniref:Short-chain dehydrogenase/reductase SDR n=1 Tax=Bacillus selenitireducens (strain ATCC 700615 / DSM 15326 / MLS10) TaxID=439292 RepID=D6Y1E5_BACIE|nr:SDR family NAD(P)-dependent oxidoreductase [Salisediminibacterium selenitireducens]ADI00732.1 short-chain dehydrogenase/reductase SDR [[Bacillus] selenitireducens MLS10]
MDMKGSVFIVAGGASGLGEAAVRMLVHYGALVLILDQNELKGRALQEDIGSRVAFEKADVTSEFQVRNSLERGLARYGDIHGVINTAGIFHREEVVKEKGTHTMDVFSEIVRVNLAGTFNVTRLAAEIMKDNQPDENGERGIIIQTSASAAFEGLPGQAAFAASMGGVNSMTLPLARELSPYGIRVMTVAPGSFFTPMHQAKEENLRELAEEQVLFPDRIGSPDEYALLVKAIISNPMLNGEVIRLDGGVRLPGVSRGPEPGGL